jgi:hypothetical protein
MNTAMAEHSFLYQGTSCKLTLSIPRVRAALIEEVLRWMLSRRSWQDSEFKLRRLYIFQHQRHLLLATQSKSLSYI